MPRGVDFFDDDLSHLHHRDESTFRFGSACGQGLTQHSGS